MKKVTYVLAGMLAFGAIGGLPAYVQAAGTGHVHGEVAGEKIVDFKDLPKVAQDAVVKAASGQKVHQAVQYEVNGRTHFHVRVGNGADRQTLVLDDAGDLMLTKDVIEFDHLPGAVKDTMGKEAGSGKILGDVEKVNNDGKVYYICTVAEKDGNEKVIRVGSDGKLMSEAYDDDVTLASEKAVIDSPREIRSDIKKETVKFDDLPGAVKTTIGRQAKSDPIVSVYRVDPGNNLPEAYATTVGKDPASQRSIFVDGKGDLLEGKEIDPYAEPAAPAEPMHPHHGG